MKKNLFSLVLLMFSSHLYADYKDDIGYSQLKAKLGTLTPDGSEIAVTQVEAAINASENAVGNWIPDVNLNDFSGKTIVDSSFPSSISISGHATRVGKLFYGNTSMASGITNVDVYSASQWIENVTLIPSENNRIVNHSWIGTLSSDADATEIAETINILKHVDRSVEENETLHITAMNNGSSSSRSPLLASAYNAITVGRTDGNHSKESIALDSVYTAGRTRPDIVAPKNKTSFATPVVSAAVAMLIDQAETASGSTQTISNGEKSEVIKAVLMAGADRITRNTSATQINDYRVDESNKTTNGLDRRYGAGQLNVYSNYQIMDAGEQDSLEEGGNATVDLMGYDYDGQFGGEDNSNNSASYLFETIQTNGLKLTASLVWNINIEGSTDDLAATVYDFDLLLYDVTGGSELLLTSSKSEVDNTENIWQTLEQGHDYKLQVTIAEGASVNWDYGLAWKIAPVPVPAAAWFFISGLFGLVGFNRKTLKGRV